MSTDSPKPARSLSILEKNHDPIPTLVNIPVYFGANAAALEKRVWLKMDFCLLPVVTMFYLLSWLDRTNLGNAQVAGLQHDLRLTNTQYSMALTVTFIPYIAVELPSNLLLKIIGPNILLPCLLVGWGLVTTLQGLVHNFSGLLACRFFIGLLEGGLLPGLVLYLSFFYPRRKLQTRMAIFFASASLAGAFSGLLASAISKMHDVGGRPSWAWIFILEGLFTFLFGVASFFLLPGTLVEAKFFSDEEKKYVQSQLFSDGAICDRDGFNWVEVRNTFSSFHVWPLLVIFFAHGTILYSLAYFIPSMVHGLGFSPIHTQLLTVGPYGVAFVLAIATSYVADRFQCRGLVVIFASFLCMAGLALFLTSHRKYVLYGGLFLAVAGVGSALPAMATWVANNFSPQTRRATAIALFTMVANAAGILSTWLFGYLSAPPRYTKGTITLLVLVCVWSVFAMATLLYLAYLNKKKREIRENSSKEVEAEGLGDRSAWYLYIL